MVVFPNILLHFQLKIHRLFSMVMPEQIWYDLIWLLLIRFHFRIQFSFFCVFLPSFPNKHQSMSSLCKLTLKYKEGLWKIFRQCFGTSPFLAVLSTYINGAWISIKNLKNIIGADLIIYCQFSLDLREWYYNR